MPHEEPQEGSSQPAANGALVKQCSHCGALQPGPPGTRGYGWRLHKFTRLRLCGPCAVYADKNSGALPLRAAGADEDAAPQRSGKPRLLQPQQQRLCLQCGTSQLGLRQAYWHTHPATGEGWLCRSCFHKERLALKRQHQGERSLSEEQLQQWEEDPEHLERAVEQQHQQPPASEEEGMDEQQLAQPPEAQQQRLCLQCGTSQAHLKRAYWHTHPATGEEWLCRSCFHKERAALQRQRQEGQPASERHVSDNPAGEEHEELAGNKDEAGKGQALQRQCLQCGSSSNGPTLSAQWHRHSVSKEEWLCHPCFNKSNAALQRQRRRGQQQQQGQAGEEEQAAQEHREGVSQAGGQCSNCGTDQAGPTPTYKWRKNKLTGEPLCKGCWNHQRKNDGVLPHPAHPPTVQSGPLPAARITAAVEKDAALTLRGMRRSSGDAAPEQGAGPAAKRPRRGLQPPNNAAAAGTSSAAAAATTAPGGATGAQPNEAPSQQQLHPAQPPSKVQEAEEEEDLFTVMLDAAGTPAAAEGGFTADLAACFWELMMTQTSEQQAARDKSVRLLLRRGEYTALARMLHTALKLAGAS